MSNRKTLIFLIILNVLIVCFLVWFFWQDSRPVVKTKQETLAEDALSQGKFKEAREYVAQIPNDSKSSERAKFLLIKAEELEKKDQQLQKAYRSYIDKAKTALDKGNLDEARNNLNKISEGSQIWEDEGRSLWGKLFDKEWKNKNISKVYSEAKKHRRINRNLQVGMTKDEVLERWGKPQRINVTETIKGRDEQWVYGTTYLYFEDSTLVAFQYSKGN